MSAPGFVPDPSWPSLLELAIRAWGQPTDWSHDKNEVRFGANGSKRVKLREMVWKDEDPGGGAPGGGYVDLWRRVHPGEPLPPRTGLPPKPAPGPKAQPNGKAHGDRPKPWEHVERAYDYRNADGVLIAQNVRMKVGFPQRFMQRQPTGKLLKNGEPVWKWSTKGLDIPLYRTPEMYRADPEAIHWISEGEKDSDRLMTAGLIATTNIAGAKSWNGERHNGEFMGRHVVILEDNDDAGRERSALIAPGLIGIAASVKVLALPNLPPKGDVSDWLDAGGTIEELERLARDLPEYVPTAPESDAREANFSRPEAEDAETPPPGEDTAPTEPEGDATAPREVYGPPTLADVMAERDALFQLLADLNGEDYEFEREAAAEKLSRGGVKFRVTAIDEIVKKIRKERADAAEVAEKAARRNQPPAPPPEDTPEVTALIAEFNEKYFVQNENGKDIIYSPKHDPDQNRRYYERITAAALRMFYLNRFVKTGVSETTGEPIYSQAANVWLRHRDRGQYIGGIVFDPSTREHPDNVLNLWKGFAVQSKAGSWEALKHHIKTMLCNNKPILFDYIMDWMADLMQHPEKQGEVAIVLRGVEGSGKGIVARALKYILGQHGFAISNAKHLTGNFNAHLRDCVFLFADEALYAGEKAHVGIMKSIITEPYLTIEGKFQNADMAKNRLHIMMATNEDWAIPASLRSRRWFVLDVNETEANHHDYFKAIQDELDQGGYEAMLHELLNRDISQVNLRDVPVTAALLDQRVRSLDTHTAWWKDCLSRGYVFRSKLGLEDKLHIWLDPISTELLFDSYTEYCRAHRERHPLNRVHFGRWLRTVGCKPFRPVREVIVGEHLVDVTTTKTSKVEITKHTGRIAEVVTQDRARSYAVSDLDHARFAFNEATRLAVLWEDADEPNEKAGDKP